MIFVKWTVICLLASAAFACFGVALLAAADPEGRGGPTALRALGGALAFIIVAAVAAVFWDA